MSATDISKGTEWQSALGEQLEACQIGIVFLTRDNRESRWLHYEAGALSKTLRQGGRVSSILLDGLEATDVEQPLSKFQNTQPIKSDIENLIVDLGKIVDPGLAKEHLLATFESTWSLIEGVLQPVAGHPAAKVLSETEKKLNEILELTQDVHRILSRPPDWYATTVAGPNGPNGPQGGGAYVARPTGLTGLIPDRPMASMFGPKL